MYTDQTPHEHKGQSYSTERISLTNAHLPDASLSLSTVRHLSHFQTTEMGVMDTDSASNCICPDKEVKKNRATVSRYVLEDQRSITVVRWSVRRSLLSLESFCDKSVAVLVQSR
ncbi:hypothetical protein T07_8166 [Trichinella nelsoni]|uniref:Uncharacterized protein n=1 Tax=Trichinella nelsoni TaxID=6336 RepID=A0A0V0RW30_9BILA|nr:hypothetical protein T07_8166 [Trichinella nelsoni]